MPRKETQQNPEEEELREGMHVEYHPVGAAQNVTTGIIRQIIVHDETVGTSPHHVKADPEHPRFVIENDKTHKLTPYKLNNIVAILD